MIKVICVSLTYYDVSKINGHYSVDYSIPGFQLELGKVYDATEPEFNADTHFFIEKTKTSYPKSLFKILSEYREQQINSILND